MNRVTPGLHPVRIPTKKHRVTFAAKFDDKSEAPPKPAAVKKPSSSLLKKLLISTALGSMVIGGVSAPKISNYFSGINQPQQTQSVLSPAEVQELQRLMDQMKRQSIQTFIDYRHPNGLVVDRGPVSGPIAASPSNTSEMEGKRRTASVASTGYGLAAWVLAVENGMMTHEQGERWALETLKFVDKNTPESHGGWLSHFMDVETGKHTAVGAMNEISTIDTALFFMGAFAAAEYFGGDVKEQVHKMFDKIDFELMRTNDGTQPDKLSLSMGFEVMPDGSKKFVNAEWASYSEGILVPFLALASKTHTVPDEAWTKGWDRSKVWQYDGKQTYGDYNHMALPLFTYYYPLGYLNLKGMKDNTGQDFWQSAKNAVEMQIAYTRNKNYPDWAFAISANDGPTGYKAYFPGAPWEDRTIAPPSIGASIPFAEKEVLASLKKMEQMGMLTGKYGLPGGYQVDNGWVPEDLVTIDVGSMLLMIDAYEKGTIHKLMDQSEYIQRAKQRAGFHKAE